MKYIREFLIIMIFTLIGELLQKLLPIPIPASVYGLLLLFLALCTGMVKLQDVEKAGDFLIAIMPVMFIAPAVKIMDIWGDIVGDLIPIIVVMVLSTVIVFAVAGWVTQWMERRRK
ncbi:MAG: CidA/LrgA family protein [Lachnospiraceae bacterium]|nr:CidA/LrgA family protein [Lachnospiraceae bacterium]